uniref:CBFD_NFYB_HMF domain-containing protein n=1 Tax=Rhabditophanes sp. KR3021 TaxID=114890 RepID=A0AC35U452_9BILA
MDDSGNRNSLNDVDNTDIHMEDFNENEVDDLDNSVNEDSDEVSDDVSDDDLDEDLDDDLEYDGTGPGIIPDQVRFLPIANISRVMKRVIPRDAKLSKEARECVQECVSEFISFISSEASEQCLEQKRKTITCEDIINAFNSLDLVKYGTILTQFLNKCKDSENTVGSAVKPTTNYDLKNKTKVMPENIRLNHQNDTPIKKFRSNNATQESGQSRSIPFEDQTSTGQMQPQTVLLHQSFAQQHKGYAVNSAQSKPLNNQNSFQHIQSNTNIINNPIQTDPHILATSHSSPSVVLSPQKLQMNVINNVPQQTGITSVPMSHEMPILVSTQNSEVGDSMNNEALVADTNAGELVPCEIMVDKNSGNYFMVAQSANGETTCIPIEKDALSAYGISPFINK